MRKRDFSFLILGKEREIKLPLLENIIVNLKNQRFNLKKVIKTLSFGLLVNRKFKQLHTHMYKDLHR